MSNYTIGDVLIDNGLLDDLKTNHSYHKSIFIPEWFSESYATFKAQVLDMCKKSKPFKATEPFLRFQQIQVYLQNKASFLRDKLNQNHYVLKNHAYKMSLYQ